MQPQPAQNMYVSAPGANNPANVRTNQQVGGLFRGPPASPAPRNGARHVPMPAMYQQAMHQSVVVPYAQFPPRQPSFQAQQYSFQPQPLQTNYYTSYQYYPAMQQPQAHQRGGVGVNNGVGVNSAMPVQTGPNGPMSGPPGASQSQITIASNAVMGAVPPGANAVLGVGAPSAGQVGVPPLVGVVPSALAPHHTQSTSRLRKHALQIIDPSTNKNILEDLDLPKNNTSTNTEVDSQNQFSTGMTIAAPTEVLLNTPQQDHLAVTGAGSILIVPSDRPNVHYNMDVHQLPQATPNICQTPVVSAMSDAPSVELLPTPQKPRVKKILTIEAPKEEQLEVKKPIIEDTKNSELQIKAEVIQPTSTSKSIDCIQAKIPDEHKGSSIEAETNSAKSTKGHNVEIVLKTVSNSEKCAESSAFEVEKSTSACSDDNQDNIPATSAAATFQQQADVSNTAPTAEAEQTMPESTTTDIESALQNTRIAEGNEKDINKTSPSDQTYKNLQVQQPDSATKVSSVEKDDIQNRSNNNPKTVEVAEAVEIVVDTQAGKDFDELDRVLAASGQEYILNAEKAQTAETSSIEPNNNAIKKMAQADTTLPTKEKTTANTMSKPSALINYNVGQWSPNNPLGKKQYDKEQLLQLRKAKASCIQPEVNNASILPQANLMPSFARPATKRVQSMLGSIGNNRGGEGGAANYMNKQGSMSGVYARNSSKGVIHLNLSLNQDVKLNETDNAWKPRILAKSSDTADPQKEKEDLVRRVRGILNKLTPEKFDALVEEIIKLKIDTPDKMEDVMVLVFEKAIDEPNFSVWYARLCHRLINEVKAHDERMESGTKSNLMAFRNALIDKTEREFTQNVTETSAKEKKLEPIIEKIKKCTDPAEKAELETFLEEEERKIRRRSGGTVRFIGELFKISMLTGKIINHCIEKLLNPRSEDMLECLCKLLTTVGAKFEQTLSGKESLQCYNLEKKIQRMQAIANKTEKDGPKVSSRVRFMLQDVIDLRKNKWQSSRNEEPKTMEQIEKETKSEQLRSDYYNYSDSMPGGGSGSGPNNSQSGSGKRDDRNNRYGDSRSSNDYGGRHSQRGDTNSLRRQQQGGGGGNINLNSGHSNGANDDTWHVQTNKGGRPLDTNKLEGLINTNLAAKKMGSSSQFIWSSSPRQSSSATTTASNSFAALSLLDSNKNMDRDRDRSGPRNKNAYNKNSMERDRYNERSDRMHSRTGSSQASRENSSSRGSQSMRGVMNPPSMQKSGSHSKYSQPSSARILGKTSGMSAVQDSPFSHSRSEQTFAAPHKQSDVAASNVSSNVTPEAVFKEPTESDLKLFKSVASEMIEITVNSKTINSSINACISRIKDNQRCGFIYYILTDYLHLRDVGQTQRRNLASALAHLIEVKALSVQHFKLAYQHFSELAGELIVDIPELWLYVFEFTGPLIRRRIVSIQDLWNDQIKNDCSPSVKQKFIRTYLIHCIREIGPSFTRDMWKRSNLKWSDFMDEKDVAKFIETNKFDFLENEQISPEFDSNEPREKLVSRIVEHIDYLLKDGANADSIIDYINGNMAKADRQFIKSLTTTLCNHTISYNDNCKLNTERFQKICIPVLHRFIDLDEELALECLYSMQLLVNSLEHPRGLLSELFGELYDADVIHHDFYIKWRDSKDQSAGKGVAVKGLNPFFNHILSGGDSSDENN